MMVPVRRRGMPRRPGGVRLVRPASVGPVHARLTDLVNSAGLVRAQPCRPAGPRPVHATGLGLAHATSLSPVRVTGVRPTGTESVHAGLQPRALSRL